MSRPVDFEQRVRALDPTQSFICEAPAGSGKTELLTQRILTLLARVEQPEAIVAITFTRKAAAEMRERVMKALMAGVGEKPLEAHAQTTWDLAQSALDNDRKRQWNLLTNPNRLTIRTFDSLCAYLNKALPLQSAMGLHVSPAENPEDLYTQAVREFIGTVEEGMPWSEKIHDLLLHLDNNHQRLADLFVAMLKARDGWLPVIQQSRHHDKRLREILEKHLYEALQQKSNELVSLFEDAGFETSQADRLFALAAFAGVNLRREKIANDIEHLHHLELNPQWPDSSAEGVRLWRGLKQLLLTKDKKVRSRLDKRCGFPVGDKDEKTAFKQKKMAMSELLKSISDQPNLIDALDEIQYWPEATYSSQQWPILRTILELLPVVLAHLRVIFSQVQEVDFIEISERARDALGEEHNPTSLALGLDQRIEHLLVDEFQDTSFSQVELLAKLTAEWQLGDGRTLFCVGDAMQSIYGFRGAKVGLFLHCRSYGLGDLKLEPLQLTSNFRSQGKIVRWINETFLSAFPAKNNIAAGAVSFSRAHDFRPDEDGNAVECYAVDDSEDIRLDINKIKDLIQQTWCQDPKATIAVLVRNRGHAFAAVEACIDAGLAFRAVDLVPLSDSPVIQDVLSLTKAMLNPLDRVSWYAILRAPWCGLPLADLLVLSPENGFTADLPILNIVHQALNEASDSREYQLSAWAHRRLSRVSEILATAFGQRERKNLQQWIEGVWVALGGPACLKDRQEQENVKRFWQMLQQLNGNGELPSGQQLDDALAKLYAAPDPNGDARLQIMTIHKSKGLEFDVVILPELQRPPKPKGTELLLWSERIGKDGQDHFILAPVHPTGSEKDAIYSFVQFEQKQREHFEACRLLYVACTRAKKKLIILCRLKRDADAQIWKPPSSRSLLSFIWHAIAPNLVEVGDDHGTDLQETLPSNEHRNDSEGVATLSRLPETWLGPRYASGALLKSFVAESDYDNSRLEHWDVLEKDSTGHAAFGTLVHEILQVAVEGGIHAVRNRNFEECNASWSARLRELGATQQQIDVWISDVATALNNASKDQFLHQLLNYAAVQCEFPIHVVDDDGVEQQFVLDLLCTTGHDKAVIVDYKTSRPLQKQHLQEFLDSEKMKYADILTQYREAVGKLGFGSVQVYLYFVMIGHWLEV